jgi:hypothetical protein
VTTLAEQVAEVMPCELGVVDRRDVLALVERMVKEERESCAELADYNVFDGSGDKWVAAAIRARKETP